MNYVANSDALSFLKSIDVDLSQFYSLMWKHTICIEFIRMRFDVIDLESSNKIFSKLAEFFRDGSRKRAVKYLEKWKDKFWIEMDENIIELTKGIEEKVHAEFSGEIEKFKSRAGYARQLSGEKKSHLQRQAKNFVDPKMLSELADVISCLKEYQDYSNDFYYILIDGLDENWVSNDIKYELIQSLIESLKNIRRIISLKIIISLRVDIIEKISRENPNGVFQSEKYDDYIQRIVWTKEELRTLTEKRINFLFKTRYSSENIQFENVFGSKVRKKDAFSYIVERTLNRPRDVIIFINYCLESGKGNKSINESSILAAEEPYSENRRLALINEWCSSFPTIEPLISFIENRNEKLDFKDILNEDLLQEFAIKIFSKDQYKKDTIYRIIEQSTSSNPSINIEDVMKDIVERLYLCGVVGLKLESTSPWQWFHKSHRLISKTSISQDTKIWIHPMLHSSCKIKTMPGR